MSRGAGVATRKRGGRWLTHLLQHRGLGFREVIGAPHQLVGGRCEGRTLGVAIAVFLALGFGRAVPVAS